MAVVDVLHGDSLALMAEMPSCSMHAIVTDPPYAIDFMDKAWDHHATPADFQEWCRQWAAEAFRLLVPGGYLLAFGGTRTYHRLASGVEDAGFEIRDSIQWWYGSGMPKGRNAATAVDQHLGTPGSYGGVKAGHEDFVDRTDDHAAGGRGEGWDRPWRADQSAVTRSHQKYIPAGPEAAAWEGWSTALKPAVEPIVVARKPFDGTIGAVLAVHGAGAIHVDATRVDYRSLGDQAAAIPQGRITTKGPGAIGATPDAGRDIERVDYNGYDNSKGRWPTNLLLGHDPTCVLVGTVVAGGDNRAQDELGSRPRVFAPNDDRPGTPLPNAPVYGDELVEAWDCAPGCPVALLDTQAGERRSGTPGTIRGGVNTSTALGAESRPPGTPMTGYGDTGAASRFYPTFSWDDDLDVPFFYAGKASRAERDAGAGGRNMHSTVKPVALMRWLLRLVAPAGGHVLDPFAGSGSTGVAAILEDVRLTCIEREGEHVAVARARIGYARHHRNAVLAGRTQLRAPAKADPDAPQGSLW